jgi:hypothetical protein
LNSGVNERRRRGFFPVLCMIGHPSGGEPLMMDVRQGGSGSKCVEGLDDVWINRMDEPLGRKPN